MSSVFLKNNTWAAEIHPCIGANCIALKHLHTGAEILRSTDEETHRKNPNVYGMPFLFPPNRIKNGTYTFDGCTYTLPINEGGSNNHIHGFLSSAAFSVEAQSETEVTMLYRATKENPYLQFPHYFHVRIRYEVREDGLHQTLTVGNDGETNMPLGVGFHTAFQIPFLPESNPENCVVRLSCERLWKYDNCCIPTGETGSSEAYVKGIAAAGSPVSAHLDMGTDGATAVVTDTEKDMSVVYRVDAPYRFWMLWNGDGKSNFFCAEPQSWMIDAPNRPLPAEVTGFLYLKPGEEKSFHSHITLVNGKA